jgi:hypothetical protein
VSVVCCQVEVSATSWSFVQRSLTECGVSKCDREASIMRRPWPTRGWCTIEKKKGGTLQVPLCNLGFHAPHLSWKTIRFYYELHICFGIQPVAQAGCPLSKSWT